MQWLGEYSRTHLRSVAELPEENQMKVVAVAVLCLTVAPAAAQAQFNAGTQKPEPSLPFTMTQVAAFDLPWRIAFLPDGRMLITEKVGPVWLVTQLDSTPPPLQPDTNIRWASM